ncbi:MAG: cobalt-precorrin-5B (C(1))-methyltransferase CbiD [Thermacetogeniaceae bacterium]
MIDSSGEEKSHRLHGGRLLRRGYTTGTCAAAAAKAAVLALLGERPEMVEVVLPAGGTAAIRIEGCEVSEDGAARAWVVKDAGDDPDVTNGARIEAAARLIPEGIKVRGGVGVGVVTKPGLPVPPGMPAINPVPMRMIRESVASILPRGRGAEVTISVPEGERLARQTMNPQLGIVGGISILGTTGIVEPMSEDAFKSALALQLEIAKATGQGTVLLTPGRSGARLARELLGAPAEAVVVVSNYFGYMLEGCVQHGICKAVLWGHAGKLAKVAAGSFQTHNRVADGRGEVVAALAALRGADREVVEKILDAPTVEAMAEVLRAADLGVVWSDLAERASRRASLYTRGSLRIGTLLFARDGAVLGYDRNAAMLLKEAGWKIPALLA